MEARSRLKFMFSMVLLRDLPTWTTVAQQGWTLAAFIQ
jgi:hypothetical protein